MKNRYIPVTARCLVDPILHCYYPPPPFSTALTMAVKNIQLRHVPYSHFILPLLQYAILDYGNSLDSETTGQDKMKAEGD